MPTLGKPAAITALPQPPKVNQKVPIASAEYFFMLMDSPSNRNVRRTSAATRGFFTDWTLPEAGYERERKADVEDTCFEIFDAASATHPEVQVWVVPLREKHFNGKNPAVPGGFGDSSTRPGSSVFGIVAMNGRS